LYGTARPACIGSRYLCFCQSIEAFLGFSLKLNFLPEQAGTLFCDSYVLIGEALVYLRCGFCCRDAFFDG